MLEVCVPGHENQLPAENLKVGISQHHVQVIGLRSSPSVGLLHQHASRPVKASRPPAEAPLPTTGNMCLTFRRPRSTGIRGLPHPAFHDFIDSTCICDESRLHIPDFERIWCDPNHRITEVRHAQSPSRSLPGRRPGRLGTCPGRLSGREGAQVGVEENRTGILKHAARLLRSGTATARSGDTPADLRLGPMVPGFPARPPLLSPSGPAWPA